jgi:Asp-tRNA(Asn)/Glu-tRNA(Gln) amidotransferase A subunit family amidase
MTKNTNELHRLPAHAAALKISQGQLKPSVLMQAYLEQVAALEPTVGAFQWIDTELALKKARALDDQVPNGLLFGLPVGVKDLIDTVDMPTTYGSPIYAKHQPAWDAPSVVNTKSQGGIVMGKTVTTEFAVFHPGKTANPHNTAHTPGGSSSGSAAAVAAHMVPLAFGTQTAASVYRPAAFCGVVGYKPTFGVINRVGAKQLSDSWDTIGTMGNGVVDAALLAAAASGRHDLVLSADKPIDNLPRVGLFRTPQWDQADADSQGAVLACAQRLRDRGVTVIDINAAAIFDTLVQAQIDIMLAESAQSLIFEYEAHRALCSPRLVKLVEEGRTVDIKRLQSARAVVRQARSELASLFNDIDVLLSPAACGRAPKGLDATGDPIFGRIWSALGNPGLALPWDNPVAGSSSDLPLGVLLSGPFGEDRSFLQAAQRIELLSH